MKAFRYDEFYDEIEEADVSEDAPIGKWLRSMIGEGCYIYLPTLEQANGMRLAILKGKMSELANKITLLEKEIA